MPVQFGGIVAVEGIAIQQGQAVFLQEGQQHRGGDPFIGVVGGIVKTWVSPSPMETDQMGSPRALLPMAPEPR